MVEANSKFTVFIRLPFSRGDFVDPPAASILVDCIQSVRILVELTGLGGVGFRSIGMPPKIRLSGIFSHGHLGEMTSTVCYMHHASIWMLIEAYLLTDSQGKHCMVPSILQAKKLSLDRIWELIHEFFLGPMAWA